MQAGSLVPLLLSSVPSLSFCFFVLASGRHFATLTNYLRIKHIYLKIFSCGVYKLGIPYGTCTTHSYPRADLILA
ncbi:hypothetical protein F4810DRAFT_253726 [Camillea tinctor]|nr:hypothetical protein F4810DRAFT_253726 [Camillea tinctor]